MATTHIRTCPLCEATCGLRVDVDGDKVVAIRGDEDDVLSRGFICPKAPALKELHEDPDRLRRPLRRTKSGWKEIGWSEALDFAAEGIHRVQEKHGRDAMGVYVGNPMVHNFGAMMFLVQFLRALRTKHRYSATSVDQLPSMLSSYKMLGHQLLLPIPDVDRTDHFLILGANPVVSGGSLMTAPGMRRRIRAIQARGGKVVAIDPRRTETAAIADEHVFIRPGSDALLLLGLLHTVVEEKLERPGSLAGICHNADKLRDVVRRYPPERATEATGIDAATIRRLAREFAKADRAVAYGRVGACTQEFGGLNTWLINALNILTGNFDSEGGAMFSLPALDIVKSPNWLSVGPGSFGRWRSTVRGLPEFGGELPVATLSEDILAEPSPIRGLFVLAGNPVLSTPNGAQLDRALASLDHVVALDFYLGETSRHAHVILPPVSPLERSHYDAALYMLAVRNTANYSPPVFKPPPGALQDWQVLLGLRKRLLGLRGELSLPLRAQIALLERVGPEGILELGVRIGPYGVRARGLGSLSLSRLKKNPHGIDLGALRPLFPDRLPDQRIDLAPEIYLEDLERLDASLDTSPLNGSHFQLVGRRLLRSNNSWMHNLPRLGAGKPLCTLQMHVSDAQRLNLSDGQDVRVRSRVGEVTVPLAVTEDLMPGVVSLPHGYGHNRGETRLGVATKRPGVSLNDLTDELKIDAISGNAALSGVDVTVEPAR